MSSTETMMKFGFMSMSMTYFSSLNMIRAMKQVGAANALFANPLLSGALPGAPALSAGAASAPSPSKDLALTAYTPDPTNVALWNIGDVAQWLDSLSLGQYKHVFAEAAVDGAFLYDLSDEDLRNTLGIEHNLHRKKILVAIQRLRLMQGQAPAAAAAAPSVRYPLVLACVHVRRQAAWCCRSRCSLWAAPVCPPPPAWSCRRCQARAVWKAAEACPCCPWTVGTRPRPNRMHPRC